jgi:hypothetical protein
MGGTMGQASSLRHKTTYRRQARELQAALDTQVAEHHRNQHAWVKPAALSSAITLLVAVIAVWGTWSGTHFGANEDREKESREKRSQIYADYLTAARTYVTAIRFIAAAEAAQKAFQAIGKTGAPTEDPAKANAAATARVLKVEEARIAFEKQADLIYVYGSDDAWQAHLTIEQAADDIDGDNNDGNVVRVAGVAMSRGLSAFQAVFCREASATPRKGCSSS